MSDSAVDIVISTIGPNTLIDHTIDSIRRSTYTTFTLWILDQSDDHVTEAVALAHAETDARIQYRRVPERGIAATRNSGAALGDAPAILFTNNDCIVDPGWIGAMVSALEPEGVWLTFGRVLPGPRPDELAGSATVLAIKEAIGPEIYRGDRLNLGFGHGHSMGARRDAFMRLGGFDELFGAGAAFGSWDDLDIGYRALLGGGAIAYEPRALSYHHHWILWSNVWRQYCVYGIGVGAAVAKYLRCGDPIAWRILARWIFYHGFRQILAGAARHNPGRVRAGLSQLLWPWRGLVRGLRRPIDKRYCVYGGGCWTR